MAALATRQGGVISRHQLLELGMTDGAIRYGLRSGRLHRRYAGVYAVGHEAVGRKGRLVAATLAYGPSAVISHRSGSDWWGFWRTSRVPIDVTVPGRSRHRRRGIDLHLVRRLDMRDVIVHGGVPVTTPARTLLDLAEVIPPQQLKRAIEEADRLRLFNGRAVDELLSRSPGRRGVRPLRDLLAGFVSDPLSRSELEALFFDLCHRTGMPLPAMNAVVEGKEVDAYWPGGRLIVELDGYDYHRTRTAFERDRLKDAELLAAGYRVMRITYRQVTQAEADVAARLRHALGC